MKKIQVLGSGCTKCKLLAEETRKAIDELGIEAELVKVEELSEIMAMGVMSTPALAVDGEVKFTGRVLKSKEIQEFLK